MSTEKQIIDLLTEFGLSSNTAKAYMALLAKNPATGYEISTFSGIPRSAIYSVLKRLTALGLVNSVGDDPKKYIPLSPSSMIEHMDHLHEDRIQQITDAFNHLEINQEAFDFWHLHGYRNLIIKAKDVIKNAQHKIAISAWSKEVEVLAKDLKAAMSRDVDLTLFSFCKLKEELGTTVTYGLDESELLKVWSPKIILVVDQTTTLMGSTIEHEDSQTIFTKNKAITEIATNHLILDITLAGQRLNFDPNPIVKKIMRRPDIHLDSLLKWPAPQKLYQVLS